MNRLPSLTECRPGLAPTEFNVLIAPVEVETKRASGLYIPDQVAETNQLAQVRGRLVAVSPLAFNYDTWPADARRPQPGDEVVYAKYAGIIVEGNDGREYRVCKDKDVACIVIEESQHVG